jgi:putative nucleotidyltransferase with HDIG domain
MSNADRRHAIVVARRFEQLAAEPTRDEMAGALLHDLGKLESGLGTVGRVVATFVGPRTERFRTYHDHESIGAHWLAAAGSSQATVDLVRRTGSAAPALQQADDI